MPESGIRRDPPSQPDLGPGVRQSSLPEHRQPGDHPGRNPADAGHRRQEPGLSVGLPCPERSVNSRWPTEPAVSVAICRATHRVSCRALSSPERAPARAAGRRRDPRPRGQSQEAPTPIAADARRIGRCGAGRRSCRCPARPAAASARVPSLPRSRSVRTSAARDPRMSGRSTRRGQRRHAGNLRRHPGALPAVPLIIVADDLEGGPDEGQPASVSWRTRAPFAPPTDGRCAGCVVLDPAPAQCVRCDGNPFAPGGIPLGAVGHHEGRFGGHPDRHVSGAAAESTFVVPDSAV